MKPFLYIDNWNRAQPRNRLEQLLEERAWPVERIRAQSSALPASLEYCGVFVGPSDSSAYDLDPWIVEERGTLRRLAQSGVPVLGLCFGSQMLGAALFGVDVVQRRRARESGFGEIVRAPAASDDPLLANLPDRLDVFHWHGDEVVPGHPDMEVLAASAACSNQIWRWRGGPAWGVQPHPEYDRAGLCAWFSQDEERFRAAGYDTGQAAVAAVDCGPAAAVFENFLAIVAAQAAAAAGRRR